jgi:SAM-dependent methyltransferase
MPFKINELQEAYLRYRNFISNSNRPFHERYIFPFFAGTYFTYRWVDIIRLTNIAKAVSSRPTFVDVGCGYGDFLEKIREYLPNAIGVEKEGNIFYAFRKTRPDYIRSTAIEWIENKSYDVAFVGWMEPGVDFRKYVARLANCIITTFDEGGQCGVYGSCEYEEFGFKRVAWWRTPSWIDVNTELMNKYYSSTLQSDQKQNQLSKLRSAHNLWYIYARAYVFNQVVAGLKSSVAIEKEASSRRRFDFESILDECGFHYMEDLPSLSNKVDRLWEVKFG